MEKSSFDKFFRNYHFVGCAVRAKDIIYLIGRKEYKVTADGGSPTEKRIEKRIFNIILKNPENERYGYSGVSRFGKIRVAVMNDPKPYSVSVDGEGQVYVMGSGLDNVESAIEFDDGKGPQRGGVLDIKAVDGVVYGVGWSRSVCKREGPNHWVPIWNKLPVPKSKSTTDLNRYGFRAIDGFSGFDIYAAGGDGDVWHYDGKEWKQIPFPSNMMIHNVCCGGDGFVYIAGHGGTVFRGRADKWTKICDGIASYWFNDMVWYQDKVWATNDYGICAFNEKGEQKLDLPDFVRSSTGYMAQGDGVLVIAGMYGASMHDGKEWRSLVDLIDLYKKYGRNS
ncbi:hypothetical protein G7047_13235 [Diaphorobacter sp. HDW4A]|uniref:hypothetical protein n=1 Tax=Diaphorobacter sp. HDW4A TaxID=2714924 RepID=UPI001408C11F|nr:hypothetical protein [Diaphorobacter sp. HDW4A]QIL80759.1 hypothetical protein G7047_13235 [Diaphorobacter sp. HDW4A]